MEENTFINAVFIAHKTSSINGREVLMLTLFDESESIIGEINSLDYKATCYNIDHLEDVINGKMYFFVWGGVGSEFVSDLDNTVIEDVIFHKPDLKIKTSYINEILMQRKKFMEKCTRNIVFRGIREGFSKIKENPKDFEYDIKHNRYKFRTMEGLDIVLVLDEVDLGIEVDSYMDSLRFIEKYFSENFNL